MQENYHCLIRHLPYPLDFHHSSVGKESACNAGDLGLIPGLGRSSGEGNDNPLQYSCLENPMDRGAWQGTVHGMARVGHDLATKPPPPCYPLEIWDCYSMMKMYTEIHQILDDFRKILVVLSFTLKTLGKFSVQMVKWEKTTVKDSSTKNRWKLRKIYPLKFSKYTPKVPGVNSGSW